MKTPKGSWSEKWILTSSFPQKETASASMVRTEEYCAVLGCHGPFYTHLCLIVSLKYVSRHDGEEWKEIQ